MLQKMQLHSVYILALYWALKINLNKKPLSNVFMVNQNLQSFKDKSINTQRNTTRLNAQCATTVDTSSPNPPALTLSPHPPPDPLILH